MPAHQGPDSFLSVRILFIEDEDRLRDALCRGLREESHDVVATGTGSEGLRLATEQSFDVIVCDILLPHLNG
ncbi:MAG TPA: response regulator, partial [Acidimicrobiales bacterium]|nr:response regulator [Acidimicrobiales bacterium]